MLAQFRNTPLFVVTIGLAALAMLVPAVYGWAQADYPQARAFLYSALLFGFLTVLLALATAGSRSVSEARTSLLTMVAIFAGLPLVCAVPFSATLHDTGLFNAWWEMVSCLTTTGATLYDPARLDPGLHLWRGMVGWMGGFFTLVMAIAVLAPLRLGGFEIFASRDSGAFARLARSDGGVSEAPYVPSEDGPDMGERAAHYARVLLPPFAGLTGALWILLMIAGDPPLLAAIHAMSTLSTSGITALAQSSDAPSGLVGEGMIFLFLLPALSRRFWPGGGELRASRRLLDDPELRLAFGLVIGVTALLFLRHWIAALQISMPGAAASVARSIWGGMFTTLSFLTTTGFESAGWDDARNWSGLGTPGLILAGLAITGGGVATTAGGVRLLRVYALLRQGQGELDRLVHPDIIVGGGSTARWLRREGAYVAWIFTILFVITILVVMMLLCLTRLPFEPASIMAIAALSNTGPLAAVAADHPLSWADLAVSAKAIVAATMVLGRVETLALVALLNPEIWRN